MTSRSMLSLKKSVSLANSDLIIRCDVAALLSSVVNVIETADYEEKIAAIHRLLAIEKYKFHKVLSYAKGLEKGKLGLEGELDGFKKRAMILRDNFAHEVGQLLSQSRTNERLKERLREAELKLAHFNALETEWLAAKRRIRELERISASFDSSTRSSGTTSAGGTEGAVGTSVVVNKDYSPSSVRPSDTRVLAHKETAPLPISGAVCAASSAVVVSANSSNSSTPESAPCSAAPTVTTSAIAVAISPTGLHLAELAEEQFVLVVSFLDMGDILGVLLSCRHLCARVYVMFDISFTEVVREEWQGEEHRPARRPVVAEVPKLEAPSALVGGDLAAAVTTSAGKPADTMTLKVAPVPAPTSVEPSLSSLATSLFNASRDLVVRPAAGASSAAAGAASPAVGAAAPAGVLTQDMVGELTKKLTRMHHHYACACHCPSSLVGLCVSSLSLYVFPDSL
jgi:hypothetical protein